jgi:peptidoglycan/xylan/chitin deacetylase (PgdA/CDA1 family)
MGYGFDDGPNCSHNIFYDYLLEQQQKATMFFIGSNVLDWPFEAMRALDEGHEICAHTWSHHYMTGFSSEDAFAELYYSVKAIKLVLGVTVTCWRPPFGDVDDRIRAIAEGLGLRTIIWKYDTFDWEEQSGNITAQQVYDNYNSFIGDVSNGTFNNEGAIILTHELNNFTMQTAINYYPQLKAAFKHMVPVGVALNKTQPYLEANYSLPTFAEYISGTIVSNSTNSSTSSASSSSSSSKNGAAVLYPSISPLFALALGLLAMLRA